MSRIELPLPLFFLWIVLTLVLMGQGMRLSATRQDRFEPVRIASLREGGTLEVPAGARHIVFAGPERGRLAVYQELPERRLVRWVEDRDGGSGPLLVPLEGLAPGTYVLGDAPAAAGAAAQEMDRPPDEARLRGRFTVAED